MKNNKKCAFPIRCHKPRVLCPTCKTGRLALESANSEVHCTDCSASFPVKNRVIDLLPGSSSQQPPIAAPMEWEWVVRIYESRWWRSGLLGVLFGISFQREYEMLLQAANLKGSETLLDLACGTGIYLRRFAKILNRGAVVGLDLSMPMLNYASLQAQAEGLENLLFIHGTAQNLPFPDNEFDVVNCCGALHLFPDIHNVLDKIFCVLKPGGRFTVAAARQLLKGRLAKITTYLQGKRGLRYFYVDELELLFKQAGLTNVTCHHAKRGWLIMSAVKPE